MSINNSTSQTNIKQIETDDIDALFSGASADSVITPAQAQSTPPKQNIFSNPKTDISFLDDEFNEGDDEPGGNDDIPDDDSTKNTSTPPADDIIDEITADDNAGETGNTGKGRPKTTNKDALVGFIKRQVEADKMFLFDDYDESKQSVDEYLSSLSQKDLDELYDLNVTHLREEERQKAPKEFYEALPQEMQYAAEYIAKGGKDLKGLFRALSQVQETVELDPQNPDHQEAIVRNFLSASKFGTPEDIEAEIEMNKDGGLLAKKAAFYKPKLDAITKQSVEQKIKDQDAAEQRKREAAQQYVDNVYNTLKKGELAGVKLDKNRLDSLYQGLVQTTYKSITGKATNKLGHLLEKHQFVEPNHELIAEALWLLEDPESYRAAMKTAGKNETNEGTRRLLKTEQQRKQGSNSVEEKEQNPQRRTIQRPQNFFARR